MPLDFIASSGPSWQGLCDLGPTQPAGSDVTGTSPHAREALAGADVVFCEENADREILRLVAPGAHVEFVVINGAPDPRRGLAISRARKLANDGWRVVWVAPAHSAGSPADLGHIVVGIAGVDHTANASIGAAAPQPFATAFNGLAG